MLTRRVNPASRYTKPARKDVCYIPFSKGGLQIPLFHEKVEAQRIRLLQQLRCLNPNEPWRIIATNLISLAFPGDVSNSPLDLLSIPFALGSTIIKFSTLSTWCQNNWKKWIKLAQSNSVDLVNPVELQARLLLSFLWHNSHQCLLVELCSEQQMARSLLAVSDRHKEGLLVQTAIYITNWTSTTYRLLPAIKANNA